MLIPTFSPARSVVNEATRSVVSPIFAVGFAIVYFIWFTCCAAPASPLRSVGKNVVITSATIGLSQDQVVSLVLFLISCVIMLPELVTLIFCFFPSMVTSHDTFSFVGRFASDNCESVISACAFALLVHRFPALFLSFIIFCNHSMRSVCVLFGSLNSAAVFRSNAVV